MFSKRKILIDGAIFGLQNSGGISRIFAELLLGLEKMTHHKVILLVPKNRNVQWREIQPQLKKIKIVKRRRPRKSLWIEKLFLTLKAIRYRPTIWHSSYYVGFPFFFSGAKIITFHDMICEIFQKNKQETQRKYISLKESDRILAISEHAANDLKRFWSEFSKKIYLVKNGLTIAEIPFEVSEVPYLLYVGIRRGYKNFLPCIISILKDTRFKHMMIYVVGGERNLSSEEKELPRVKWFQTLPFAELQKLMRGCQALLFPSLYEGFGLPILEAFHHEVPVAAFRTSAISEVVGDEYPLADLEKGETLNTILGQLLEEREKWISYGRKRKDLFTREKMVKALLEHYDTI